MTKTTLSQKTLNIQYHVASYRFLLIFLQSKLPLNYSQIYANIPKPHNLQFPPLVSLLSSASLDILQIVPLSVYTAPASLQDLSGYF